MMFLSLTFNNFPELSLTDQYQYSVLQIYTRPSVAPYLPSLIYWRHGYFKSRSRWLVAFEPITTFRSERTMLINYIK